MKTNMETYSPNANAPSTKRSSPSLKSRILAFIGIITSGTLGAVTGYTVGDLLGNTTLWQAIGMVLGALSGAIGVGIITVLALQGMIEWKETGNPPNPVIASDKTAKPKEKLNKAGS